MKTFSSVPKKVIIIMFITFLCISMMFVAFVCFSIISDFFKANFEIGYEVPMISAANSTNIILAKDKIDQTLSYMEIVNAGDPYSHYKTAEYTEWRQKVYSAQSWMNKSIIMDKATELTSQQQFELIRKIMVESGLINEIKGDKTFQLIYPKNAWYWIG